MADSLTWKLTLKDGVSGPASKASSALKGVEKGLEGLQRKSKARMAGGKKLFDVSEIKRADGDIERMQKRVKNLGKVWKDVQRPVRAGGKVFAGAAAVMGGLAIAATAAGVGLGVAAASQIYQAQAFKADTMFAFQQILKSRGEAERVFALVGKTSFKTGSDLKESLAAMNTLLAQGFKADFADELMRAMADLRTLNPQTDMAGIIRAVAQIKNTGRLQGDELNQLANAGVSVEGVYRQIAKAMKLTDKPGQEAWQQVRKLQEAGKVDANTAIGAIMASIKETTGGEFGSVSSAKADTSISGMMARLLNLKDQMLMAVNVDWSPISRAIGKVMAAMQSPAGKKFLQAIGDGISSVLGRLDKISQADLEKWLDKGTTAATALASVLGSMLDVAIALQPAFMAAADAITVIWAAASKIWGAVASTLEAASKLDVVGMFNQVGVGIVTGIVSGIVPGPIVEAVTAAAAAGLYAAKSLLGIRSPSTEYRDMYLQTGRGAVIGIERSMPQVVAANENMARSSIAAAQVRATMLPPSVAANSNIEPPVRSRGEEAGYHAGEVVGQTFSNATTNNGAPIVNIGSVQTQATDAKGIASSLAGELRNALVANG